jgi:hypothetical protein
MNNIYCGKKMQPVMAIVLLLLAETTLMAQNHVSVPVAHGIYYILEQAETRGLCPPLPSVKPYTRAKILEAIDIILAATPGRFGGLSDAERAILENTRAEFTKGAAGRDIRNGMYRYDVAGKKDVHFSGDFGIAMESLNSGAYYMEEEKPYLGTDTWGTLFVKGDVSEKFSFNVDFSAGLMRAQRTYLGEYDSYATELSDDEAIDGQVNTRTHTYSQPLAFFPYTYQKRWDGFMFGPSPGGMSAGGMEKWPQKANIAAAMTSEMSGSAFEDMLLIRFGRMQREWGAMTPGSSLVLNAVARPFIAIEANFSPVPWFAYSSITGVLEFNNAESNKAWDFQNAYSLQQMEINYKSYFHISLGSSAIWAKRFELGYAFPLLNNFFYQNFIGDFDNMGVHLNVKAQYPGLGKFWFSFLLDEIEISSVSRILDLDRHMFAYQAGMQGMIPGLPFSSLTLSYTKVEPYTYTHTKGYLPWYGSNPMDTSYVNNGVSLGHYLPPNSDEIKVRFETRPWLTTQGHVQYQMIRHGADYGSHQVDGSSLVSELDPSGRGEKASLRKNFLHDGAYQWMHIIKVGASHTFKGLPITVFGETGLVYSYFTDISNEVYATYSPPPTDGRNANGPPSGDYLKSTAFILTLGFKIFK